MPAKLGLTTAVDGEKEFNDALKSINASLKQAKAEMELVTETYAQNKNSGEALSAASDKLANSEELQKQKVELLKNELQRMTESGIASERQIASMTLAVTKAETELQKTTNKLQTMGAAMDGLGTDSDDAANKIDNVTQESENLAESASSVKNDVDLLADKIDNVGDASNNASGKIVGMVGSICAIEIAKSAADGVKQLIDMIVGLGDNSRKLQKELDRINKELDKCRKQIGDALAPIIKQYKDEIVDIAKSLTEGIIKAIKWIADNGPALARTLQTTAVAFTALSVAIIAVKIASGDVMVILAALAAAFVAIEFSTGFFTDLFGSIGDACDSLGVKIKAFFTDIGNFFKSAYNSVANGVSNIINSITDFGNSVLDIENIFSNIRDTISNCIKEIGTNLQSSFGQISNELGGAAEGMSRTIVDGIKKAVDAIIHLDFSGAVRAVTKIIDGIKDAFRNFINTMQQIGQDLADGLTAGITKGMEKVKELWEDLMNNDVIKAVKSILKISSPSKVFFEIGENTAEGFNQGFSENLVNVQNRIESETSNIKAVSSNGNAGMREVSQPQPSATQITQLEEVNITLSMDRYKLAELLYDPLSKMITRKELSGLV